MFNTRKVSSMGDVHRTLTTWRILALSLFTIILSSVMAAEAPNGSREGYQLAHNGTQNGIPACMSCHGADGEGNAAAAYPALAGLPKLYLIKQLNDFKSGSRHGGVMQPFARAMSDQQMEWVAEYYSGLKAVNPKAVELTEEQRQMGKRLTHVGKWEKSVPACFHCHGEQGQGIDGHFPPIANQHHSYLIKQLKHWRHGERKNDPIGLMQNIVSQLTDDELDAVARYLNNYQPTSKE